MQFILQKSDIEPHSKYIFLRSKQQTKQKTQYKTQKFFTGTMTCISCHCVQIYSVCIVLYIYLYIVYLYTNTNTIARRTPLRPAHSATIFDRFLNARAHDKSVRKKKKLNKLYLFLELSLLSIKKTKERACALHSQTSRKRMRVCIRRVIYIEYILWLALELIIIIIIIKIIFS